MSTTPTTSEFPRPAYTAIGGDGARDVSGLAAVILDRGGRRLRRGIFADLEKAGFDLVVAVESLRESWDVEELASRHPFVRFVLLPEDTTLGERVNLAAQECRRRRFLVLANDMAISHAGSAARIAERTEGSQAVCLVPAVQNSRFEPLPTLRAPAFYRGSIKTVDFVPSREGEPSLYPWGAVGLYDRDRFLSLGGYDGSMRNPYWQLMDFGFRARLWGESIASTLAFKLVCSADAPVEDLTPDEGYKTFYLRNLAPSVRAGEAHVPFSRFPAYWIKSGSGLGRAWREFSEARAWVARNKLRFARDARTATELWEAPEA